MRKKTIFMATMIFIVAEPYFAFAENNQCQKLMIDLNIKSLSCHSDFLKCMNENKQSISYYDNCRKIKNNCRNKVLVQSPKIFAEICKTSEADSNTVINHCVSNHDNAFNEYLAEKAKCNKDSIEVKNSIDKCLKKLRKEFYKNISTPQRLACFDSSEVKKLIRNCKQNSKKEYDKKTADFRKKNCFALETSCIKMRDEALLKKDPENIKRTLEELKKKGCDSEILKLNEETFPASTTIPTLNQNNIAPK